ncbi:hypothetical protein [Pedobacter metabolipauper]|uniref:Uncharacterized protein n=1 Tax=Pedobacter metabolipauper TaxID=425513 RepID=A0A4R6SX15_9SPHI|nr:hypothetical protein [Pedobacter metabolipauper]TDQ10936.1 hypothetical protein ATK78_0046 [Pedobacter metabolipauper]
MVDLSVQPKRKSKFWLWVLLIIIAAGLTYFILNKDNNTTSDKVIRDSTGVSPVQ